jgi:hypothetical protein
MMETERCRYGKEYDRHMDGIEVHVVAVATPVAAKPFVVTLSLVRRRI